MSAAIHGFVGQPIVAAWAQGFRRGRSGVNVSEFCLYLLGIKLVEVAFVGASLRSLTFFATEAGEEEGDRRLCW